MALQEREDLRRSFYEAKRGDRAAGGWGVLRTYIRKRRNLSQNVL